MVGVSRQTVNRVLRRFEASGLISIAYGRVTVRDLNGLAVLAGDDPTGMRPEKQVLPVSLGS